MLPALVLALALVAPAQSTPAKGAPAKPVAAPADPNAWTPNQSGSYAFGVDVGRSFVREGVEVDVDLLVRGLRDALAGKQPALGDTQMDKALSRLRGEFRARQELARRRAAAENRLASEAFLAENAKVEGVISLPSGLQYKVLTAGQGQPPSAATETLTARWRAALADGTEVEASPPSPQGAPLRLALAPAGIREALSKMAPGARWQVVVPAHLAYGERGRGREIPPNATLVYDLELVSVP